MVRKTLTVLFLGIWLPAQAEIVRYHGADGRLYFSNLPPSPRHVPPAPGLGKAPASGQRLAAPIPTLRLIHELAHSHNVEPRLVQAIITVESNFNPQAISRAGAQGLMQLMPGTAARYRVANPFDPRENVEGGIRYLKDLFQMFPGDIRRVLAAYNAGQHSVLQYGGVPPYPETQLYVERVLTLYGRVTQPAQKIYRYHLDDGSILLTDTPR